jgi:hypothetical protein
MKTWITIPTSELHKIDWNQTRNANENSVPRNIAGDTALIKWVGDMPSSIAAISNRGEPMDRAGAGALLKTADWYIEVDEPSNVEDM